jgi:hypothetical protein
MNMRKVFTKLAVTVLSLGPILTWAQKMIWVPGICILEIIRSVRKLNWHNEIQYRNFDALEIWSSF